jgi:hypothetical protein
MPSTLEEAMLFNFRDNKVKSFLGITLLVILAVLIPRLLIPDCYPYCDSKCPKNSNAEVCAKYHKLSSATGHSQGKQCEGGFEGVLYDGKPALYEGLASAVVAQVDEARYPRHFQLTLGAKAWLQLEPDIYTGQIECLTLDVDGVTEVAFVDTSEFSKNTVLDIVIPLGSPVCMIGLVDQQQTIYSEHFVSNPKSPCLGWVECGE